MCLLFVRPRPEYSESHQQPRGTVAGWAGSIFKDRAPSTLRKHLSGWRRWLQFCRASGVQPGCPACPGVGDFLEALPEGASCDRGSRRSGAARGVIHALHFIAHKLGLEPFAVILNGPIVSSWLQRRSGPAVHRRRPYRFLYSQCASSRWQCWIAMKPVDSFLMGCFLVMLWSGLRFSDAQRVDFLL